MTEEQFDTSKSVSIVTSTYKFNQSKTFVLPNDVGGRQGCQKSHWQTKTKVIRPIPLNIGQPLVHFNAWNHNNKDSRVAACWSEFASLLDWRNWRENLTMVEPTILKTIQRVKQRHVKEATHLPNDIDGEQADNHSLENKKYTLRPTKTRGMNI